MVPSSFSQNWGGGNRASTVVVESPIKETLSTTKEIQGKVVSSLTSTLSSVTNGIISMEKIRVGDTVKKNQLIATQDSTNIKYSLRIKKNQLVNAKISLEVTMHTKDAKISLEVIIHSMCFIFLHQYFYQWY